MHNVVWLFELGIWIHKSTLWMWAHESTAFCSLLSLGYVLQTHKFSVAFSVGDMDSKPTYCVAL